MTSAPARGGWPGNNEPIRAAGSIASEVWEDFGGQVLGHRATSSRYFLAFSSARTVAVSYRLARIASGDMPKRARLAACWRARSIGRRSIASLATASWTIRRGIEPRRADKSAHPESERIIAIALSSSDQSSTQSSDDHPYDQPVDPLGKLFDFADGRGILPEAIEQLVGPVASGMVEVVLHASDLVVDEGDLVPTTSVETNDQGGRVVSHRQADGVGRLIIVAKILGNPGDRDEVSAREHNPAAGQGMLERVASGGFFAFPSPGTGRPQGIPLVRFDSRGTGRHEEDSEFGKARRETGAVTIIGVSFAGFQVWLFPKTDLC